MKAIMVMFDSLNRHMLPPYGCNWVHAPNFQRLAERAVTFDNCYAGSLPCMPARRDLHTGRYNFLHRGWGNLEPFDDSMPELLKNNGVYTHLVSDHHHYWEDGGANYHTRYSSWEAVRGQEYDCWKAELEDQDIPEHIGPANEEWGRQYWVNRKYIRSDEDHYQVQTFRLGMEFIRSNHKKDRWFLQIEAFDPHEPFYALQKFRDLYPHDYNGPHMDWPIYGKVSESPGQVEHCRLEYAALLSMCDDQLGKVLDLMDELDLWKDTMLIVNTDHGFLLSEHDMWGKNLMPCYNEISHIPLFVWDPRSGKMKARCSHLVQNIDMAPTLLDFFEVDIPEDMQGKPLRLAVDDGIPLREACLFGYFGGYVHCTDGRYVYMRATEDESVPIHQYTLMPVSMRFRANVSALQNLELAGPFGFTKGCKTLKLKGGTRRKGENTLLFDLESDPQQLNPFHNPEAEAYMAAHMVRLMKETEAPKEQFQRMGFSY